jgi:hypothetical protein
MSEFSVCLFKPYSSLRLYNAFNIRHCFIYKGNYFFHLKNVNSGLLLWKRKLKFQYYTQNKYLFLSNISYI